MERLTRRAFALDLGRAAVGIAVFGSLAAACQGGDDAASGEDGDADGDATTTDAPTDQAPTDGPTSATADAGGDAAGPGVGWRRVNLGSVSAFVVVRAGEAAIVDTGVGGSRGAIEEALAVLGVSLDDVTDIVVTHKHDDHAGSLAALARAAPNAALWAGAADIPNISSPRDVTAAGDGDTVFGLDVIETPGHTAGHISVHDAVGGVLFAGDALRSQDGAVIGPAERFTADMDQAMASVRALGELAFETALVGHGDPVVSGADAQVRALANG